ncbi:MAG: phage tail protein [Cytophagales bacterium]|nr:phage tail protein [Cytophagales bacterium]
MGIDWTPAVTFFFKVEIMGFKDVSDYAFKEVSGLSVEVNSEEIKEGGENSYAWKVPVRASHGNLVLKRGLVKEDSQLSKWVQETVISNYQKKLELKHLNISLLGIGKNDAVESLALWRVLNARPVKWSVSDFDSMKNELAIESLEFAYTHFVKLKS